MFEKRLHFYIRLFERSLKRLRNVTMAFLGGVVTAIAAVFAQLAVVVTLIAATLALQLEGRAIWSGDQAPKAWLQKAKTHDILEVEDLQIAYWGRPDARYSKYATRKRKKPRAIVVHFTRAKPVRALVEYGHRSDPNRGGAAFGYHFYVGRDGNVVQGAPLSRRTNHIKFYRNKKRTDVAKYLWSGNTIGVSLIGGCDLLMRPDWRNWRRCTEEYITPAQLEAGLAVIRALQTRYGMKCEEVYGHGDLQTDRESFEGYRLSRLARESCDEKKQVAGEGQAQG